MSLDDVSRRLAQPMPRRRAITVIGGAVLGVTLGRRPAPARASHCTYVTCQSRSNPNAHGCCLENTTCCYGPDGEATDCCSPEQTCDEAVGKCKDPQCFAPATACGPVLCCLPEETCCGGQQCCGKGDECVKGSCRAKCPSGRTRCGSQCCPKGQRCVNGRCRRCERGHEACGKKCCGKGQFCCNPRRGLCCKKKGGDCCFTDPGNENSGICCQAPSECARAGTLDGLNAPGNRNVCCPPNRQSPGHGACCPPGSRSYGADGPGRVGVGIPMGCCPNGRLCGKQCLARARGAGVWEECCGGTPRNVASDPANCGACGIRCAPGQGCHDGVCG